ncbi:MAG: hypothetical protein ACFCD0_19185 [Gemmataceae bacterium]
MRTHIVFSSVLAWALLGLGLAVGQQDYNAGIGVQQKDRVDSKVLEDVQPPPGEPQWETVALNAPPSPWIEYCGPASCISPRGGDGPIKTEFYVRGGASFPFGDGIYGGNLETGWSIQGGARIIFYPKQPTGSWFLDVSVLNIDNGVDNTTTRAGLNIIVPDPTGVGTRVNLGVGNPVDWDGPPVTIRGLTRTFLNIGGGKMWYFGAPSGTYGRSWRIGVDGGGRYGTGNAQFFELRDRDDVMGGIYVGAQADMFAPCGGCCLFTCGIRTEWSYTWTDILQVHNNADTQDILLQLHLGVIY